MFARGRGSCERAKGGVKECEGRRRWLDQVEANWKRRARAEAESSCAPDPCVHTKSEGATETPGRKPLRRPTPGPRNRDRKTTGGARSSHVTGEEAQTASRPCAHAAGSQRPRSRQEGARAAAARGASEPPALAIPSPSQAMRHRFCASSPPPYLHTSPPPRPPLTRSSSCSPRPRRGACGPASRPPLRRWRGTAS